MSTNNNRVSLAFTKLSDADADEFGANVIVKLTGNAAFPSPPISLAVLTTQRMAFHNAITAAMQGGVPLTAAKNAARDAMEVSERAIASYVQSLSAQSLTQLFSSGFLPVNTNRASSELDTPNILLIEHGNTTQLFVSVSSVVNARSYEVQIRTGTGDWQTAGVAAQSRGILLDGLTPGIIYDVQVRAIGGSTGSSLWSSPVSQMAT